MKCNKCHTEIYYRESTWVFVLNFLMIVLTYLMGWFGIMTFMAVGGLGLSWIYNNQRPRRNLNQGSKE